MGDGTGEGLKAPVVFPSPWLGHKEADESRQPQPGVCNELSPAQVTVGPQETKGTLGVISPSLRAALSSPFISCSGAQQNCASKGLYNFLVISPDFEGSM